MNRWVGVVVGVAVVTLGATHAVALSTAGTALYERTAMHLRAAGINAEVWYDLDSLGKQLKYASARGVPNIVIIGPDEAAANLVTLRYMQSGEQRQVARADLVTILKQQLSHA